MFPDRPVTIPNDPHNMGYQITSDPMWAFNSPQMQPGLMPPQLTAQQPPQMPQQPPQMPQQPPMSFGPNQMLAMQMGGYPGPSGIRPQMQMNTMPAGLNPGIQEPGPGGQHPAGSVMNPTMHYNEGGKIGEGGSPFRTNTSWMDDALRNASGHGYGPSGSLDLSGMGGTIKDALNNGRWGDALKGAGKGLMVTGNPLVALATGAYNYFKGDNSADPGYSHTPAQTFPYDPQATDNVYPRADFEVWRPESGGEGHSMRQPIPITRRRRPGTSNR